MSRECSKFHNTHRKNNSLFVFSLLSLFVIGNLFAADNVIMVHYGKESGAINKKVFGNNFLGFDSSLPNRDSSKSHYYGHADYGAGIWDSKWNETNEDVIRLAKDRGITILRFPGGAERIGIIGKPA